MTERELGGDPESRQSKQSLCFTDVDVSTSPSIALLRSVKMLVDRQNSYDSRHVCLSLFALQVSGCPREGQTLVMQEVCDRYQRIDRVHGCHAGH